MKKICIMLVCITLLVGVMGCGKNTDDKKTDNLEPSISTEKTEEHEIISDEKSEEKYTEILSVPFKDVYLNYKRGRRKNHHAGTVVFATSGKYILDFAYESEEAFTGNYKDVFDYLNDGRVLKAVNNYITEVNFKDYESVYYINKLSEEDVNINGIDMQRIKGEVVSDEGIVCDVYGYAFVLSDVPCMLLSMILTENPEQDLVDSLNEEVEIMIKTARTEMFD